MKHIKIFLLAASLALSAYTASAQEVFRNKDLTITKLRTNLWEVETSDKTSMYILEGKNKAMLIDTGTKCDSLDKIVKKITNKPLYVVITHAHGDHAGNIHFFPVIYMHPADSVLMKKYHYEGKINYINEGHVFDLGGTKIEVAFTPGHTPGSIVFFDKKGKNCFSGDAFGSSFVWLQLQPSTPMDIYTKSCEKMEKIMNAGIDSIYGGHYSQANYKALGKSYIISMHQLAKALVNGTEPEPKPYPIKRGAQNPMITTLGEASIVFDPEHIK